MKKIWLLSFLLFAQVYSQEISGIFVSPFVGARFPLAEASKKHKTGFSFGGSFEYGTSALPFIMKVEFNYTHFPQKGIIRDQYESKSITGVGFGIDYLLFPLIASETILTPFLSVDLTYNYIERQILTYTYRFETFTKQEQKFGFAIGGGFSFFLVEFTLKYHYLVYEPYIGIDYRLRLPISISY
ncbi:MAG: hypothetical protein WHV63_06700 [Ignavibacteria bacterium]|jgi:hypothetical protein|nr:hypothetical protein [Ignavibacteria bacterium]